MSNKQIYLDNSATTKPYDEVTDYMKILGNTYYGNPSSMHSMGLNAEMLIKEARAAIAETLGARTSEIYFTSGGTESNNLAIAGYLEANGRKGKHIITSRTEHPSVLEVIRNLERKGYTADYIEVDSCGKVNIEKLANAIRPDTALVSIMYINNETGAMQPIKEIGRIIHQKNPKAAFHSDAVQAYGKVALKPETDNISLLSMSSHKVHGPKGAGALYIRQSVKISPIIFGGGQESGLRSGTENVPGICGFGMAAKLCFEHLKTNGIQCLQLKNILKDGILKNIERAMFISDNDSSPYILNVSFPGLKSEVLLHSLEQRGIFVSTGSACHSRKNARSYVLTEMGYENKIAEGAIRISFSLFNTEDEVRSVISELAEIVPVLRKAKEKGDMR